MIILSHSGKQHSYHTAKSLNDLNLLEKYYTSSYICSAFLQDYITKTDNTYWSRRYLIGLPGKKVDANWRFELKELVLRALQGKSPAVQEAVYQRDINFDRYVAKQLRKAIIKDSSLAYWGFQGSCHDSLEVARREGILSFCELATAHVVAAKRILGEEAEMHKEWSHTIDNLSFPAYYEKRLEEEPHLASFSIAASSFTKNTLIEGGIDESKILLLPLGFDVDHIPYTEPVEDSFENRPLKLLYAGTVTQRKGIKYLLEAMSQFAGTDVELHIVGGIQGSDEALMKYKGNFIYHPPVSQQEMFKLYSEFDALVLPTIFEGFGLVIVEAMAAGLPVITTPHSIGPELIVDDESGYIIPIRNIERIVDAISKLRHKSSEELIKMKRTAREAALNYSWDAYTQRLGLMLNKLEIKV